MNKFKKSMMVILLFITLFTSVGCSGNIEENLQKAEDFINTIEERGKVFFRGLGNALEDAVRELLDQNSIIKEEEETSNKEVIDDTNFEDYVFVSQAMESAYLEIPITYDYDFDSDAETYLLDRLNKYREENGLGPLEIRKDLSQSSRYKSLAMLQYDYFSHDNPNFKGKPFDYLFWDVLKLKYSSIGENLAFVAKQGFINRVEAEELFQGWKNSPSHNAQMLTKVHKYVGIGVVRAKETGPYYKGYKALIGTQHFGY